MRYLIRAFKYLAYFMIFFILIVGLLFIFSSQRKAGLSFTDLFEEGSFPKLAIFFVVIAAVYPALGFQKRKLYLNGDFSKYAGVVHEAMESLGYALESEDGDTVTYRLNSGYGRATRMWEDRITFSTNDNPVIVEGIRKDLVRIASAVNFKIKEIEPQEAEEM